MTVNARDILSPLEKSGSIEPLTLVVFGASGDLTRRKLLPAIFQLWCQGLLNETSSILGFARSDKTDESFRRELRDSTGEFLRCRDRRVDDDLWSQFAGRVFYHRGTYDSPDDFAALRKRIEASAASDNVPGNCVYYLATPPTAFAAIVAQLGQAGLARRGQDSPWARIVIEKPFGQDSQSARQLNEQVTSIFDETQIFRIDHYLGKETVQNIMVLRFANSIFEHIWSHDHIDHTFDLPALDDLIYSTGSHSEERKCYCFVSKEVRERHFDKLKKSSANSYDLAAPFDTAIQDHTQAREHACLPNVCVAPFATEHEENSFGIKCTLRSEAGEEMRIGITSDTAYYDELPSHLEECDLIVAHLSHPDFEEYKDQHHLKKEPKHLGLNGTRKLIENTDAQVYFITEFWGGKGDVRVPLCQKLKHDLKRVSGITDKCILPADMSLKVTLGFEKDGKKPCFKVACTSCKAQKRCQDITVVRPDQDYGSIRYLCPNCSDRLAL